MAEESVKHIHIEDGDDDKRPADAEAEVNEPAGEAERTVAAADGKSGSEEEKTSETSENASPEETAESKGAPEAGINEDDKESAGDASEKADADKAGEEAGKAEEAESERYMRLMAEFQNYKRRAAREKADTLQYANEKIVGDILPVLDNFERALEAEGGDLEAYAKGMQLIFEQLKKALENAGLEEIKALDEAFDPNVHNAVMTANIEDKDDGIITMVLQKGYKLRDRVVRPSMVAVNKK